jgi:hypothetical protein
MQRMGASLARQVARRDGRVNAKSPLPHLRLTCKMEGLVKRVPVTLALLALFGAATAMLAMSWLERGEDEGSHAGLGSRPVGTTLDDRRVELRSADEQHRGHSSETSEAKGHVPTLVVSGGEPLQLPPGEEGAELARLVKRLRHRDPAVREDAAWDLAQMGPAAAPVVPALIKALYDPVPIVREWAAEALGCIGPAAAEAAPRLGIALRDRSCDAPSALSRIGLVAIPTLTKALANENPNVRIGAAQGLRMMGPDAQDAVPALITAITRDGPEEARDYALYALGAIGPAAKDAVPTLEALARSGDRDAEAALKQIRGQ